MKLEIERKFLVKNNAFKDQTLRSHSIVQGYLSKDPERTVRVRIIDKEGWLTIKGKSNAQGTSRSEWEKAIPLEDAKQLLVLAIDVPIEKIRHIVPFENFTFEVDEFLTHNKNLLLAEIELPSEDTSFPRPDWLGEEVTGNPSYYNAMM
ncbi:MAG: CYTH domain-containing protein [Flavobacteriaceae bacterium]|jgi:adenylate cyclase|nr:CYTH domain-containing protein [Flavobacteriaceae bacterium]MDA8758205.1 CYTH domain-containing protein [Flavobacteriaceae bacterium]MDB2314411.1 CYTH domain-containing protein [Flavobacteriaceae bacterium]MDB2520681.1 CYTH domain-containing protein [Flavobacteriaceae bacterium]MDC0478690.1 CYTH domain-containing protein [Flavobacteriaceae bacterium]